MLFLLRKSKLVAAFGGCVLISSIFSVLIINYPGLGLFRKTGAEFRTCLKPLYPKREVVEWNEKARPLPCSDDISIVLLIKSSLFRNSLRSILRSTWAQEINVAPLPKMRRIFLVGSSPQGIIPSLLEKEIELYKDILQGTFEDTFRSVTAKVILGMKFVKQFCPNVKYIFVSDDDTLLVPWNLFPLINDSVNNNNNSVFYFAGFIYSSSYPSRDTKSRWFVSLSEYSCSHYATYSSGMFYVFSYHTMVTLYELSQEFELIWLDDVFFGLLAQISQIPLTELPWDRYGSDCKSFFELHSVKAARNISTCHDVDLASDQSFLWNEFCQSFVSSNESKVINNLYCESLLLKRL